MLVSVIMPNYNGGQYLAKSIDSVLNQTYTNIECIIIDDCSTDNSITILNNYFINIHYFKFNFFIFYIFIYKI